MGAEDSNNSDKAKGETLKSTYGGYDVLGDAVSEVYVANGALDKDAQEAAQCMADYLTTGDYTGFLKYFNFYGKTNVLPEVLTALHVDSVEAGLRFTRIVEFGAGFGWLGHGLSEAYDIPAIFVDMRELPGIDVVANIETNAGAHKIQIQLRAGDLIVMSEFLHCLNDPRVSMMPFAHWPKLVVEYWPQTLNFLNIHSKDNEEHGSTPIRSIYDIFPGALIYSISKGIHGIWLINKS